MRGWAFPVGSFVLGRILPGSRLSMFFLSPCVRNMLELEYLLFILCKTCNSRETLWARLLTRYFPKLLEPFPAGILPKILRGTPSSTSSMVYPCYEGLEKISHGIGRVQQVPEVSTGVILSLELNCSRNGSRTQRSLWWAGSCILSFPVLSKTLSCFFLVLGLHCELQTGKWS